MTTITFCSISEMTNDWQSYLGFLEEEVVLRVQRMRRKEDQQRTICAHLLAKMTLSKTYQLALSELSFIRDKKGKYQTEREDIHFNISHTGKYVACAVSSRPVGIDIEQQVPRDFLLFQTLWSEEEKQHYNLQDIKIFYALWTAKESYGKYKGIGLHSTLTQTTILQDGAIRHIDAEHARIVPFSFAPCYSAAVCLEDSVESILQYRWSEITMFFEKGSEL
jgi:4'-phosphopantetheinyl transferase